MILADTGFVVAMVVATDKHHKKAVQAARKHADEGLLTTWPVLTEVFLLIQRTGGPALASQWLGSIDAGASTDARDFGAYRWKRHKPFRNLLPA